MAKKVDEAAQVKTGIAGLDELTKGGFERNSVVIVGGESGSGKSTLALQFLYNGATQYNEPGIYVTFEESKNMIFRHMLKFGWDFEELERKKLVKIVEYPPHEVEKFISEGSIIEDLIKEHKAKRLVMDSITSFALLFESEYKRRQAALKMFSALRKWGCTTLLTAEASEAARGELKVKFGMEFLADGFIAIHTVRKGDVRDSGLEVVKLRGIEHEKRIVPLKIAKNGITLFPKQPVFGKDFLK